VKEEGEIGVGEGWIRALSALSFRQGEVRGFPVKVEGGAGVGEE
jgi:hypothetical protein